jgi:hypothetical protein
VDLVSNMPTDQESKKFVEDIFKRKTEVIEQLRKIKLTGVNRLPDYCVLHTCACTKAGTTEIYLSVEACRKSLKVFETPLKPSVALLEAGKQLVHEVIHQLGETDESRVNLATLAFYGAWKKVGHSDSPHWLTVPPTSFAEFGSVLQTAFFDWDGIDFVLWDFGAFKRFNSNTSEWKTQLIPNHSVFWKRPPADFKGSSEVGKWVNGNGIVFGKCYRSQSPSKRNFKGSGAYYNEARNEWKWMSYENAPSPRVGASLLSDGKRLLVWGGASCGNLSETLNDGAWFDPEKNTWEPFTLPNQESVVSRIFHASFFFNNSIIFWGGFTNQKKARFLNDGWIYSRGDLISISKDKAPRPRHRSAVASSSEYLMVYGGEESERGEFVKQGGIYSYKDSKWKDISVHQAPEWTWKEEASSFWVGTLFTILHPKGISFYDPYDDSWTFQRLMSPKYPQYSEYSKFLWNGFEGIYWDPIEYKGALFYP